MVTWIGMIVGMALLMAGVLVLLGLVKLFSESKLAASAAAFGLMTVALVFILMITVTGTRVSHEFDYGPPPVVMERWATGGEDAFLDPPQVRRVTPPPRVSPPVTAAPPATRPASHVQAEVTEIGPANPLATAPASVPAGEIEPGSKVPEVVAGPRPDWVGRTPEWIEGEYRVALASGLFPTVIDSGNDLAARARRELSDYYAKEYQVDSDAELTPETQLDHLVDSQVLRERYIEPVESDILDTTMYRSHGLLVISPDLRSKLDSIWRQQLVDRRLATTGRSAGGLLALLGLAWGVLKLTGRRQVKAAAA